MVAPPPHLLPLQAENGCGFKRSVGQLAEYPTCCRHPKGAGRSPQHRDSAYAEIGYNLQSRQAQSRGKYRYAASCWTKEWCVYTEPRQWRAWSWVRAIKPIPESRRPRLKFVWRYSCAGAKTNTDGWMVVYINTPCWACGRSKCLQMSGVIYEK